MNEKKFHTYKSCELWHELLVHLLCLDSKGIQTWLETEGWGLGTRLADRHMHKSGEQWLGRVVGCMKVIDYG